MIFGADDLAGIFDTDAFAVPATYRVAGAGVGSVVAVIPRRPDLIVAPFGAATHSETSRFLLRADVVTAPRAGDTLEIGGIVHRIQGVPVRDAWRVYWTVDAPALDVGGVLDGALAAALGLVGGPRQTHALAGALAAGLSLSGDPRIAYVLAGVLSAGLGLSGGPRQAHALAGVLSAGLGLSGGPRQAHALAGAISAGLGLSGDAVTTAGLVGVLSAALGLSGGPRQIHALAGTLSAALGLSGGPRQTHALAGALTAAANLAGDVAVGGGAPEWLFDAAANLDFDFAGDRYWLGSTEYGTGAFPGDVTRASAGWAFDSADDLDEWASGEPRINDSGLTVEGAATNSAAYPDMTGATTGTLGSGGALPTSWTETFTANGAAIDVTAGLTVRGMPAINVRMYGTTAVASRVRFGANAGITGISAATAYVASLFMAHVAGTLSPTPSFGALWFNAATAFEGASTVGFLPGSTLRRYTLPMTSSASAAKAHLEVSLAAGTFDLTLQFAAPQFEDGATASTPIVHGSTSGTRAADVISDSVTGLISDDQTWLMQWSDLPYATGADRVLFDLSDGTTDNQIQVAVDSADDGLEIRFRSGGGDGGTVDLGECPPDGILALSIDQSTGDVRASISGDDATESAAAATVSAGSTFTTLHIGADVASANAARARIRRVGHVDGYVTTSALALLSAGLTPAEVSSVFVWLDPSDLSTMWQEIHPATLSTQVASDGDPVGTIQCKLTGRYYVAPSSGLRPLYKTAGGLHWLEFTSDALKSYTKVDLRNTDKVNILAAIRNINSTTPGVLTEFSPNSNTGDGWFAIYTNFTSVAQSGGFSFAINTTGGANGRYAASALSTDHVIVGIWDFAGALVSDEVTARRDGAALSLSDVNAAVGGGNMGDDYLFIGARNAGGTYYAGRLYGYIGTSKLLRSGIPALERYLAAKSGATLA